MGQRIDPDFWYLPAEDLLGFVEIPTGQFLMGSDPEKDDQAYSDEQPQHELTLPSYFMARYPVTVAQFRAFVEDQSYDFERWRWNTCANHPVVEVSWHEALAYCQWLNEKLISLSRERLSLPSVSDRQRSFWQGIGDGTVQVTLPSEAEWEYAAKGGAAAKGDQMNMRGNGIYPWGDLPDPEKANYAETGIGNTSAVGCFAQVPAPLVCRI